MTLIIMIIMVLIIMSLIIMVGALILIIMILLIMVLIKLMNGSWLKLSRMVGALIRPLDYLSAGGFSPPAERAHFFAWVSNHFLECHGTTMVLYTNDI